MTGYVLRRSILTLGLLGALLAAGGGILVWLGVPVWIPFVVAMLFVAGQWAVSPYLIQWLVPADELERTADGYATGHPVGEMVARRCRDAEVPLVRLGIVDDGTPNAFTFGHVPGNARIWLTRGLLERLDERELDAVIAHEVGHVRQNDIVVMAVASTVPLILYYVFLAFRESRNQNTAPAMVGAFLVYLLSELVVLGLSRARELGADAWSCRLTGDGDALCSALVKVGYGMGEVDAERAREAREVAKNGDKDAKKAHAKEERRRRRVRAAGALGIADPAAGSTILAAAEQGLDGREVMGALRWDTCNPWARFEQLFSTHPLVVRRIAALEASGLPGAPTRWSAREVAQSCEGPQLSTARRRFALELPVRYAPWVAIGVALLAWSADSYVLIAQAVTALGAALLVKAWFARRPGEAEPIDRVASLMGRLDASPVTGLPVSVHGEVIGRATPGYALSPDLVVQDESGFVPVLYRQPWPFARTAFGLLRVPDLMDQRVSVRGWYRRTPAPVLELRELVPADGRRVRGFGWVAAYVLAGVVTLAGAIGWAWLLVYG